jgi:beta-lactam-binding protein with PASTA domain
MRPARKHLRGFGMLAMGFGAVVIPVICAGQTAQNRISIAPQLVPNVQGMLIGQASAVLERLGLKAEQVRRTESDAPAGTVLTQDPQPRSRVVRGSTVELTVSTGRPAPGLRMPDLVGMMPAQANAILARLKIRLDLTGMVPSPQPTGTIARQYPLANADLPPSRVAQVTLASALPARRVVPNVVGIELVNAMQILTRAGLTTSQRARRYDPSPAGTVVDQDPSAGQDAYPGSSVNVTVSEGPQNTATAPSTVIVPGVDGQNVDVARAILARARLTLGQVEQTPDPSPRGFVFDQSPRPGGRVPAGTQVSVRVSDGGVYVPDVIGHIRELAEKTLSDAGLGVGGVRTTQSAEPAGQVIGQSPLGGALVSPQAAISLVVSSGPSQQAATIMVPDLVGMPEQEARAAIASAGLTTGSVRRQASSRAEGTVVDQDPAAGSQVASGKAVQLFVSSSSPQPERTVSVPDLSGLSLGKARDILAGVQLNYSVTTPAGGADEQALVKSQSPVQGERVQPHTTIQLELQPPSTAGTLLPWAAGGLGFLSLGLAVAYGLGKKNGNIQASLKPGDVERLSLILRRNWRSPRIAMRIGNAPDLALRFTTRRDPGRQTMRIAAPDPRRES